MGISRPGAQGSRDAVRLPGRFGEAELRELLGGALVLMPRAHLHAYPELVERAAQEGPLDGEAGEADVTGWLKPDGLERRRQVVRHVPGGKLSECLGPGPGRLAGFAEALDCLAQL